MPLAVSHRLWNRCAEMPFIAPNPPTGPPIRLYLPLGCAYHALLPFVPRSCADRPFVGQNLPPVSFIPQNRPSVISKPNPGCLKSFKKKFLEKKIWKKNSCVGNPKKNFLLSTYSKKKLFFKMHNAFHVIVNFPCFFKPRLD